MNNSKFFRFFSECFFVFFVILSLGYSSQIFATHDHVLKEQDELGKTEDASLRKAKKNPSSKSYKKSSQKKQKVSLSQDKIKKKKVDAIEESDFSKEQAISYILNPAINFIAKRTACSCLNFLPQNPEIIHGCHKILGVVKEYKEKHYQKLKFTTIHSPHQLSVGDIVVYYDKDITDYLMNPAHAAVYIDNQTFLLFTRDGVISLSFDEILQKAGQKTIKKLLMNESFTEKPGIYKDSQTEILERAKKYKDDPKLYPSYHYLSNNSQHFATFIATGYPHSWHNDFFKDVFAMIIEVFSDIDFDTAKNEEQYFWGIYPFICNVLKSSCSQIKNLFYPHTTK